MYILYTHWCIYKNIHFYMCDPSCQITHHCHSMKPHYYPVSSCPSLLVNLLSVITVDETCTAEFLLCVLSPSSVLTHTHAATVARSKKMEKLKQSWAGCLSGAFHTSERALSSVNPKRGSEVVWRGKTSPLSGQIVTELFALFKGTQSSTFTPPLLWISIK